MSLKYLSVVIILFISNLSGYSQSTETYVRAKIDLRGKNFNDLVQSGIETDHGVLVPGKYFISDFGKSELLQVSNFGFSYQILIDNVSDYYASPDRVDEEEIRGRGVRGACDGSGAVEYNYETPQNYKAGSMNGYFTYSEIMANLEEMAEKYPELISKHASINNISTHNGNFIQYVKVSDNVMEDEEEPEVLYTALHHAREPNSASQMIFYLWYLLENYGKDPLVNKIINETELYFIPCINPDGYLQNQVTNPTGGGLWRKNMWKDSLGNVKGVDLNRNYGYFWGYDNVGSSINPNSQTFRGKAPFSEPETQAIRAFCLDRNFSIAQNYHTFGNYLIHPWGYNDMPTDEDKLFKGMGRIFNKENQFLMGTATETVGYNVNGVSDDWMYGEIGEKSKIYSYTPEVGPSFWPAPGSIDRLNKSCLWMNLSTALMTLSYYEVADNLDDGILTPEQTQVALSVSRFGLKQGICKLKLTSLSPGFLVLDGQKSISLDLTATETATFTLAIDPVNQAGQEVDLLLEIDNDGIVNTLEITRQWVPDKLVTIFEDKGSNPELIAGRGWTLTDKSYVSSPTSITDSDNGNYIPNADLVFTYEKPISLELAKNAFLEFQAKWDIEPSYDFVQVLASRDSIDFIPLCGKFSQPGTADQGLNSPVYDGKQEEWVKEFINLSDFAGSKQIWLRFQLKSDENLEKDGFYIDDLRVLADIPQVSNTEEAIGEIKLMPTIQDKNNAFQIVGVDQAEEVSVAIYNALGVRVFQQILDRNTGHINPGIQESGAYFYTISAGGKLRASGKFMVR